VIVMAWTLLRASIDGALVVAAVWILTRTLTLSPATRTFLWWCAAAKFVLALAWTTPILIPVLPAEAPAPAAIARAATVSTDDLAPPTDVGTKLVTRVRDRVGPRIVSRFVPGFLRDGSGLSLTPIVRGLGEWGVFAALMWSTGLILIGFVAIGRWHQTEAILRASRAAGEDAVRRTADLAVRIGLKRVPDVRISDRVETPLVAGLRRPVILLPAERFAALSERQQEMVLCHELTHLKRADLWLGCVPALAERLFFFHPLAHVMSREYSIAREAACDAAVVETLDAAPREYGCLLLALGVSRPQTGAAAGAWSFLHLKRRIAMLQEFPTRSDRSRAVAAAAVGLALLALVPLRLVARPAPASAVERLASGHASATQEASTVPGPVETAPLGGEAVEQERREPRRESLNFVLFLGENQQTVSGSADDLRRAERHRKGNESLLWVRVDGREYVIRDGGVLKQARDAWREFNAHELHELIGSEHFAEMARLGDSKMFEHAGRLGAEAGQLGVEMGARAMELAHEAMRNLHVDEQFKKVREQHHKSEALEHERFKELHSREMHESVREMNEQARELSDRVKHEVEHSIKQELDRHRADLESLKEKIHELEGPLRELAEPMRDLAEPMAEIGRHMGRMGHDIGDYTARAMEQMRAVIEQAIASGRAQSVK
jgi:bla regulator protein BlaR1